jgi:hypothetical protein
MKTIAAILFFILPCSLHAQLKKGQWFIGGIADFSHASSDDGLNYYSHNSKTTQYRLMPGIGYFFADKFCGGLRLNISSMKSGEESESTNPVYMYVSSVDNTVSGIGFSPFLRYYFLPASGKVNLFVDGSYTYNDETIKTKIYQKSIISGGTPSEMQSEDKTSYGGSYYSIAAGPAFFIGKNVAFELTLGCTVGKVKEPGLTSTTITFGTGFQVYFGK